MPEPESSSELCSWKEIAAHLKVSVKTAQLWERARGLPVRRLPGPRSQVRASVIDLTAWERQRNTSTVPEAPTIVVPDPPSQWRWWLAASIGGFAILLLAVLLLLPRRLPGSFRVSGSTLIVLDEEGREFWRHRFPAPLEEASYTPAAFRAGFWTGILGGRRVVLFRLTPHPIAEEALYCFTADGKELWHYVPGRAVTTDAGSSYAPPFALSGFVVAPFGSNGESLIAVAALQNTWWPSQVTLLTPDGKVAREYWHAGYLDRLATITLQGHAVLLAGGVNNARHAATLVALDIAHWRGASVEENPAFQYRGMQPGIELRRFIFPRSRLNERLERYNAVESLTTVGDDVTVAVREQFTPPYPQTFYTFDQQLHLQSVGFSDMLLRQYHDLALSHALVTDWNAADEEALSHVTDIHDGKTLNATR
jgi:hypothetical protein